MDEGKAKSGKARTAGRKVAPENPQKPAPLNPGLIGVDEAGRGPVIGPMVVVALRVKDDTLLKELNVRDSKVLSPARREELYGRIKAISTFQLEVVSADEIDELRKSRTMNEIELDIFASVIGKLMHDRDEIFVDAADVREAYFGNQIALRLKSSTCDAVFKMVSKHKADSIYPVVSAASIVAKVTRDHLVADIEKELRKTLDRPLGSGYPADPVTISFMENWIKKEGDLPPHTRRSWDTAQHLLQAHKTTTLDGYGIWSHETTSVPNRPEDEKEEEKKRPPSNRGRSRRKKDT